MTSLGSSDKSRRAAMNRSLIENVENGNLDKVRELLKMGADVNYQDERVAD
jgi:ankyrin repeat protein